jgi:Tol biopolymer transport system component
MLMRPDGTNKRALRCTGPSLTSGSHRLAYSPNGRYLAGGTSLRTSNGYGYRWAVTVVNLKTRQSHIVYRYNSENGVVSLTWSPDSSQLVANVEYGGGYGMFRISVATRRLIKSYKTANFASASWKPGTRMLLCTKWFASEPGAPWRTQLRRLDGTLIKTIGEGQADPVYSPDGSEYAFLVYSDDGKNVRAKRPDSHGSNITSIYAGASDEGLGAPAWR